MNDSTRLHRAEPYADRPRSSFQHLAVLLREGRSTILDCWERSARELPAVGSLSRPALRDHVPALFDHLTEAIRAGEGGASLSWTSQLHAIGRMAEGAGIDDIIREYHLLRECLLQYWYQHGDRCDVDAALRLGRLIDFAVTSAVKQHTRSLELERASRMEAEEALALLDSVIAASPVGIAIFDRQLRYVRLNDSLARVNSRAVEDHLGRTPRQVLGDEVAPIEALTRQVLDTGAPLLNLEFSGHPPGEEGRLTHFLLNIYPVRRADGAIIGTCNLIVDITPQKRAEDELRRAAHFREQFVGILGHDLRNPLSAITLASRALAGSAKLEPAQRKMAARILNASERMSRMITDVLDFTQGRLGGSLPVDPRPTDLHAVARQAIEELESAYPGRQLWLEKQGDARGSWDPDRLTQVVSNLVANALHHGAPEAPVGVRVAEDGDSVRLEVHNLGSVIPAEQVPLLFEPFRRAIDPANRDRTRNGLGLGLYIVQQVVQAHQGEISVESSERTGTTFSVRLPRDSA